MIEIYSGETLVMPILVSIEGVTDLSGSNIIFRAKCGDTVIDKTPTVNGMTVTATLESADTLIPGVYTCEFRALIGGVTKTLDYDIVLISYANIREVMTNG